MKTIFNIEKMIAVSLAIHCALLVYIPQASAGPFDRHKQNLSVVVGAGTTFEEDYIIFGVGYSYHLLNGLSLGVDMELWTSGDPTIYQVAPELQYVINLSGNIRPYASVFYRRNYIEGEDDLDATGYRAGVYYLTGENSFLGYGIVHTEFKDCDEAIYQDCEDTHSELTFMLSF